MISDGPLVELLVIVDWSEFSTFLLDKEEGGCVWAL